MPRKYTKEMVYTFKFCYKNGKTDICGGRASKPEYLCYDFDGQLSWKEYDKFVDSHPSVKEILINAKEINKDKAELSRIEIINVETNETVDFVEM